MILYIDDSAIKQHTDRLREMHRSALPVVIRQTLNSAAYDVKQNTMPEASNVFVHRKPTFFKANSKVKNATGFDINSMAAIVGFIPKPDAKDSSVSDLLQQEEGGEIHGRSFIPLSANRVGGSWFKNVRTQGRWRAVRDNIVDSKDSGAPNKAGQFRSSAKHAGVGGLVIGNVANAKGNRMVWRIEALGAQIKMKALFALKPGRVVEPEATHFMRKASIKSANKMYEQYAVLAEKKIMGMK